MANDMIPPSLHESAANNELQHGDTETAKVHAMLAIASAINKLAEAQEDIANARNA
jgi:hypothetical protein